MKRNYPFSGWNISQLQSGIFSFFQIQVGNLKSILFFFIFYRLQHLDFQFQFEINIYWDLSLQIEPVE